MERIPVRPAALGAVIALAVAALTVFLLGAAGVPIRTHSPAAAVVYSALYTALTLAVLRWTLDAVAVDRLRYGLTATLTLLATLLFAGGLASDALTMLVCLLATVSLVGIELFAGSATVSANEAVGASSFVPGEAAKEPSPEDALRLSRSVSAGNEHLEGQIRFEIPANETTTTLHVPLWPPLPAAPLVTCELEGIEGRVRVPFAKPHGFRIEVRLPAAVDEPLSGVVRFTGECTARAKAA